MQGRVREGGDHLAALGDDCKGYTSFSNAKARFRRNRFKSIVLPARSAFGAIERCFRLFPILTAAKGRSYRAVLRFCMRARAYPQRRLRESWRFPLSGRMEKYLDNM